MLATSNRYSRDGSPDPQPADYRTTRVGDATDTLPYFSDAPAIGNPTATYTQNIARLIAALEAADDRQVP